MSNSKRNHLSQDAIQSSNSPSIISIFNYFNSVIYLFFLFLESSCKIEVTENESFKLRCHAIEMGNSF